jgi:hypothetical protein
MNNQPPTRPVLIAELKSFIKTLEAAGAQAERMAPLLAARGWPTGTLGDGGSRSTSTDTSTERAADHRDRWADADEKLARLYVQLVSLTGAGSQFITNLAASAGTDADHEGDGMAHTNTNGAWCLACTRWVPGTAEDRIRSGFCNACRVAWNRLASTDPHADRASFIRNRPKHTGPTARPAPIDPATLTHGLNIDVERAASAHGTAEHTTWHHGNTTTTPP